MKITKPYELLIRFGIDGVVSGAHVKTQSYYLDGLLPDLATWREDQATTADLAGPLVKDWCDQWNIALHRECEALRATVESQQTEIAGLREALVNAQTSPAEPAP